MIHQIKALYNDGNGLSERQIASQLGISRNTVSKYLKLSAADISALQEEIARGKKLDDYRVHYSVAANLSGLVSGQSAVQTEGQSV